MGNREDNGRFASGASKGQVNMVGAQGQSAPSTPYKDQAMRANVAGISTRKQELQKQIEAEDAHTKVAAEQQLMLKMVMPSYTAPQVQLSQGLHSWFKHQGFWPASWTVEMPNPFGPTRIFFQHQDIQDPEAQVTIPMAEYVRLKKMEKLGLIVTEVAECMEAVRKDDIANELEELADIDVRMLDYKGGFGMTEEAPEAFGRKMHANYQRPHRHGKQF